MRRFVTTRALFLICMMAGGAATLHAVSCNVGVQSSVVKLNRDGLNLGPMASDASISLAGNEHEAFQLVISGATGDIKNLRVTASNLVNENGVDTLSAADVHINPVGYVKVEPNPGYTHESWTRWPDPLVNLSPVDVPAGKVQPIWVDVYAPAGKTAGRYTGTLTITGDNMAPRVVNVSARVRNFDIPLRGAFDGMCSSPSGPSDTYYHGATGAARDQLTKAYIDIMLDHRMSPGGALLDGWTGASSTGLAPRTNGVYDFSLAEKWGEYARARGMGKFVAAYTGTPGGFGGVPNPPTQAYYAALTDFLTQYDTFLKAKGWRDDAMVYNIDEVTSDMQTYAKQNYARIKAIDPRLKVFQCFNDTSGGVAALTGYVDVYDITLGTFPGTTGAARVAAGDEVWSCLCCWPTTHPNLFVDYPAMDARIVGVLSWKLGLKGFEYWDTTYWDTCLSHSGDKFINSVMPDWSSNSFAKINGDGLLLYPGPDNTLLSSIRFENLRDGFEDYEYLALLRDRLALLQAMGGHDSLVAQLLPLLNIPSSLCGTDLSFGSDPGLLAAYRLQVADGIEAAFAVPVPEPSTMALILSGATFLCLRRCRRTR